MSIHFMYILFYLILHGLFSIFECIYEFSSFFVNKIVNCCYVLNLVEARTQLSCKTTLESCKVPKHVTVLLGTECPSYQALSNLVIWCLAAKIPYISFYDHKGILNKNQSELEYEIDKKRLKEWSVIWHNDPSSGYKNGYIGRKIHIKILSNLDGKSGVVSLCKELALSENKDFSIEHISENLHKHYEFPDPDLGLYCGKVFSLFNYPPWQMRVTEFINLKSHRDVTFEGFKNILLRYGKCEQRLGK